MRPEENISAEEPWPQRAGERGKRWRRIVPAGCESFKCLPWRARG